MCHGRLFEAWFLGSPGGENWRVSILWVQSATVTMVGRATVPSKFAAMWSKQRWPPRYKRHNFCDWDRMAWAPELQPRPKWFQMIAISRQRAQTESAAYLYTKCYETIPILPQICHFMRLALLNWGAQKTLSIFKHFLSFQAEKGVLL